MNFAFTSLLHLEHLLYEHTMALSLLVLHFHAHSQSDVLLTVSAGCTFDKCISHVPAVALYESRIYMQIVPRPILSRVGAGVKLMCVFVWHRHAGKLTCP